MNSYTLTLKNVEEMERFLETHNLPGVEEGIK